MRASNSATLKSPDLAALGSNDDNNLQATMISREVVFQCRRVGALSYGIVHEAYEGFAVLV